MRSVVRPGDVAIPVDATIVPLPSGKSGDQAEHRPRKNLRFRRDATRQTLPAWSTTGIR